METSLHRELKQRYGPGSGAGGRLEVSFGGFRVDAVTTDGALVEVQSGPLGPLRPWQQVIARPNLAGLRDYDPVSQG